MLYTYIHYTCISCHLSLQDFFICKDTIKSIKCGNKQCEIVVKPNYKESWTYNCNNTADYYTLQKYVEKYVNVVVNK